MDSKMSVHAKAGSSRNKVCFMTRHMNTQSDEIFSLKCLGANYVQNRRKNVQKRILSTSNVRHLRTTAQHITPGHQGLRGSNCLSLFWLKGRRIFLLDVKSSPVINFPELI